MVFWGRGGFVSGLSWERMDGGVLGLPEGLSVAADSGGLPRADQDDSQNSCDKQCSSHRLSENEYHSHADRVLSVLLLLRVVHDAQARRAGC